jgi:death-on-curing protein
VNEPIWLTRPEVDYLHGSSVRQFGGSDGVRDASLIESALARPINRLNYEPDCDLAALAASYGYGLVKNHGYIDGNKRIGFLAMSIFLYVNGFLLETDEAEATITALAVAAGDRTEEELAVWIRDRIVPLEP